MRQHLDDDDKRRNTRVEAPGAVAGGIARPKHIGNTNLFPGWGPRLF